MMKTVLFLNSSRFFNALRTTLSAGSLAIILSFFSSHLFAQSAAMHISLKTTEGNSVMLNDLKGEKLTVLDFWATWCKPCVKSIPKLVELSKEYEGPEVKFLGINEDSPRNVAKVRPFANSLGIPYPVLLDTEQELMNELLVSTFPTLIILDRSGGILYTHEGYTPGDEVLLKEKLEELLAHE